MSLYWYLAFFFLYDPTPELSHISTAVSASICFFWTCMRNQSSASDNLSRYIINDQKSAIRLHHFLNWLDSIYFIIQYFLSPPLHIQSHMKHMLVEAMGPRNRSLEKKVLIKIYMLFIQWLPPKSIFINEYDLVLMEFEQGETPSNCIT